MSGGVSYLIPASVPLHIFADHISLVRRKIVRNGVWIGEEKEGRGTALKRRDGPFFKSPGKETTANP